MYKNGRTSCPVGQTFKQPETTFYYGILLSDFFQRRELRRFRLFTKRWWCSMSISIDDLPSELQTLIESHVDPLEPITPDEAISEFIDDKRDDITPKTADDYEKKLEYVREYFNKIGLENLNELNGREIKGYSKWRKHESSDNVDELSKKTMRDDLYLFADFLRFAEMIDAVEEETAEKVDPPNLDHGEGVRDVELEIDFIKDVTHYLSKYHYGSREHVVFKIIEETGRRLGCIHSLDLSDANLSGSDPYLEFRHHDDRNTRLKNKRRVSRMSILANNLQNSSRIISKNSGSTKKLMDENRC